MKAKNAAIAMFLLAVTPFMAAPSLAAQRGPTVMGKLALNARGISPVERAEAALKILSVAPDRGILVPSGTVRIASDTVTHFQQQLDGIPVWGGGAAVFERNDGTIHMVTHMLQPVAGLKLLSNTVSEGDAVRFARTLVESSGRKIDGKVRSTSAWLKAKEGLALVRIVDVTMKEPFEQLELLVYGQPARLLWAFRRTPNAVGYAYRSNPADGDYEQVELLYLTASDHLEGDYVRVLNCAGVTDCPSPTNIAAPDTNGDYLIEPTGANDPDNVDDAFCEVQGYYGINTIHDYFEGIGYRPGRLDIYVNYPMQQPNAFYDQQGNRIVIGQSMGVDLAVENDVIFHEYGHHVFGEVSQAGMFEMDEYGPVTHGLAINEASADYYSCAALNDPELGEYFASRFPQYFTDPWLRNVENEKTCPRGLYGEAHADSEIWSGFLWDARQLLGAQQADVLYVKVLAAFPQSITFPVVAQTYLDVAAAELEQATVDQLHQMAEQRGLLDCERFIELWPEPHRGWVWGKEILGQYGNMLEFVPAELHYYLDLPQNAVHLKIGISKQPLSADVAILVRKDQRIQHTFSYFTGLQSEYDFMLDGPVDIDLPSSDPPFEPGHTYYFQVVNRGQPTSEYRISGEVETGDTEGGQADGGTTTDGGVTDEQPDGGAETDGGVEQDGGTQADGGGTTDGGVECPEGYRPVFDGAEWTCVPECEEGYEPKLEGDTWICAPKSSSGCGCSTGSAGSGLVLVLLGMAFLYSRRKADRQ